MRVQELLREAAKAPTGYDLQSKYDHFNGLLFGGKLPQIPLEYAKLKNVGGEVNYRVKRSGPPPDARLVRLGIVGKYDGCVLLPESLRLKISVLFQRSEEGIDKILIHEMIHVHLLVTGNLNDNHGEAFKAEAQRCGKIVGFEIPLTESVKDLGLADDTAKPYGVLLLQNGDGSYRAAIMSDKVIRDSLEAIQDKWGHMLRFDYAKTATAYSVTSPGWTLFAAQRKVSRKFDSKIAYWPVKTPDLIDELKNQGTVLLDVVPDPED